MVAHVLTRIKNCDLNAAGLEHPDPPRRPFGDFPALTLSKPGQFSQDFRIAHEKI